MECPGQAGSNDDVSRETVMIKINDVSFEPHPDIGTMVNPKEVNYAHDYVKVVENIKGKRYARLLFNKELGEDPLTPEEEDTMRVVAGQEKAKPGYLEMCVFRDLIRSDLWFLLYFVVKPFADDQGRAMANHPFVVKACQEIELGPQDYTLDIWARFHFKSSIMIAETIQFQLKNPEYATGIFSHKAPVAKDFLGSIRSIFENERILAVTHPDVVWDDCKREARPWSIDEGLTLKRKSTRKESSISAHGLIEGMPTGLHFERRVYDDITTNDLKDSIDLIEKVKHAFDVSQNLKTLVNSHHRVIGTYYSHLDPLLYVRDKKDLDGNPKYLLRFKPATIDGTAIGKPVLMTQEGIDELKGDSSFNCQQLLDPTPQADQRLNPDFLQKIERQFIPRTVYKFMIIDQAGDDPTNKSREGDSWAIAVFGVEPVADEIGQAKVFIEQLWIEPAGESEAIDQAVKMYISAGIIKRIGVEKVGISTTHLHISKALRARGRYVEFTDDKTSPGVLLRPAGRTKKKFIEGAVAWPLNNSKLFYSSEIPNCYVDRLKMEMNNFPLWHDDALNTIAYLYDVIKDYSFLRAEAEDPFTRYRRQANEDRYFPVGVLS